MQRVILRGLGSSRAQVLKLVIQRNVEVIIPLGSSRAQVLKPLLENGHFAALTLGSSRAQVLKQSVLAILLHHLSWAPREPKY